MPSAILRLVCSVVWAMSVVVASAGVMTFVHDRVPDMEKYPPLPDVVLDHIPVTYMNVYTFNCIHIYVHIIPGMDTYHPLPDVVLDYIPVTYTYVHVLNYLHI